MKKYLYTLALALFIWVTDGKAQTLEPTVISSGGNYSATTGFSVSWTLGETAVQYIAGTSGSLSQGFQQSVTSIITAVQPTDAVSYMNLSYFPNPVSDKLHLDFNAATTKALQISVVDMLGRVHLQKNVPAGSDVIDLDFSAFPAAIYFLRIAGSDATDGRTIKIQKIN